MVCTRPKTLWIRKSWDLDIKDEYHLYKKINKKLSAKGLETCTTQNLRKIKNKMHVKNYEKKNYTPIEIPCGICLGCRLDHANMWATRVWMETKCWNTNCFVTLTYNEQNLPKNKQLIKKDMQDFFKRLLKLEEGREEWENPITKEIQKPIRRFYCGEYGEKNKRPHYHAALFNYKPKDLKPYKTNRHGDMLYTSKTLQKIWGHGFVIIGELNYKSACYIARYVQKKAGISGRKLPKILRSKTKVDEFIEMSRCPGIGLQYWMENKEKIKRNGGILIKINDEVKNKKIPRYFKKKWEEEYREEYDKFVAENRMRMEKEINQVLSKTTLTKEEYLKVQEESLKERTKILKRLEFT